MELNFTPVLNGRQIIGSECLTPEFHFFFGTIHGSIEMLNQLYPKYRFCFLRQIHSVDLIEAQSSERPNADGHWTSDRGKALIIQTADCLPVLLVNSQRICAVHAGWRGIAGGIARKAALLMAQAEESLSVAIGPHIQFSDFEVGTDVATLLNQSVTTNNDEEFLKVHADPNKRYVNLAGIVQAQIAEYMPADFFLSPGNTLVDPLFHSYRRGKAQAARNFSFAARL